MVQNYQRLDAINCLLSKFNKNLHFSYSIALILRPILLDSIIYHHTIVKGQGNKKKLLKYISGVYCDHVDFTMSDLEKQKELFNIDDNEYDSIKKFMQNKLPELFDVNGNTIKQKGSISNATTMVSYVIQNGRNRDYVFLKNALHYSILSKCEHLGISTETFIKLPYNLNEQGKTVELIILPIAISVDFIRELYSYFTDEYNPHFQQFMAITKELEKYSSMIMDAFTNK
jgi:hypothetical protein